MAPGRQRKVSPESGSPSLLLGASALVSVSEGALFIGVPFLLIHLGRTASEVGLVGAVLKLAYIGGLVSLRRTLAHGNPRVPAVLSCAGLCIAAAGLSRTSGFYAALIWAGAYGLATSLFWPPVVGLLSSGLHDEALNRRLGRFNLAWSGGMLLGPWLGGILFEVGPAWPFRFAAACNAAAGMLAVTYVLVARARSSRAWQDQSAATATPVVTFRRDRVAFLAMARVALISGYMVIGLLRYQLPNLAKDIHIGEATFGVVGTLLSASLTVSFWLLGRISGWHYQTAPLWLGQGLMAAVLLVPIWAERAWQLAICVAVAGQIIGLCYSSHLFYRTSHSSDRAGGMANHELLLSIGFLLGAFGGGLVARLAGNRQMYWVAAAAVVAGVAVQIPMWLMRDRQ